jgi:hypothetical protein
MKATSGVNRVTGKPLVWLCCHEAGHAVADLVLDELPPYPMARITSVSVVPDPGLGTLGRVIQKPRTDIPAWIYMGFTRERAEGVLVPRFLRDHHQHALYELVQTLAGPVAEYVCRHGQELGYLHFAMRHPTRNILSGAWDCDGDFLSVRRTIEWLQPVEPSVEVERLWRIAYALIVEEWPGILKVARLLRKHEFMTGKHFEQAWREGRPPVATRRRLAAKIGMAGWREKLALPALVEGLETT